MNKRNHKSAGQVQYRELLAEAKTWGQRHEGPAGNQRIIPLLGPCFIAGGTGLDSAGRGTYRDAS